MFMYRNREKGFISSGFTMIEVLVAILILTIGIVSAIMMQTSAIHGNQYGNKITQATFLAEDKIEEIKNSSDIGSEVGGTSQTGIFTQSWQFTAASGSARRITVTVSWAEQGSTRQVVLNTITRGKGY
jgi:type IV pilus modification protein PilV